jgi:hypothetical protein
MIFRRIQLEPYVITFKKNAFAWNLFEFLNNTTTQAHWCAKWTNACITINLTLPKGDNNTALSQKLHAIMTSHNISLLWIRINHQFCYINTSWIQKRLTELILFFILIILGLSVSSSYLNKYYTHQQTLIRYQNQRHQNQINQKIKTNKHHNHTIITTLNTYLQLPQLYTDSIKLSSQKITLIAYYKIKNEKKILKKLWKKNNVTSQTYHIIPLNNNWRKLHYVWHITSH